MPNANDQMTPAQSAETYAAAHEGQAPLTKQQVFELLAERGIGFEAFEHPPIRTVEEADRIHVPFERHMSKNFFLRDAKKRNYYLVTVPDHKKIDLRLVQERLQSKRLSFASPADLAAKLGVWPGSVTPLAALNDDSLRIPVALDADFERSGWIGCHPCDNTASVLLRADELAALVRDHGSPFSFIEL